MNNPEEFYRLQINKNSTLLQALQKQLVVSSIIRFILFIAIIAFVYFGYPNAQIIIISIINGTVFFLLLVNRHSKLSYKKRTLKKLIALNQLELSVLAGNYDQLDTGSEFIDPRHPYSHDIDLFGPRSFFQFVNRTTTVAGKHLLATIFQENAIDGIKNKQEAIKNLSEMPVWRQKFSAIAALVKVSVPVPHILNWLQGYQFFVPKVMKVVPFVFSAISIGMLVLLYIDIITFNIFLLWFFIGLGIIGVHLKKINKLYGDANKVKDTFEQYYKLVNEIEKTDFTSYLLKEKQQQVINQKEKASDILQQFSKILNAFDQRNNMMYGIFGNGLLLWDLIQSYRIEQWIANHRDKVTQWFDVISFFDAYNSLGNFAFNNPTYIYPALSEKRLLQATNLGHPMLNVSKRVDNDIVIDKEQFFIITGANMAGKSTFLRTIALQIVMSNTGLPICATTCSYKPIKLITSMRTSDSLSDEASYFFSELTQLKSIVSALEKDEYFIILDEILKGTNSKDKAAGSRKFIEKLVKAKATGIIATHDLSLCEVATTLSQVKNKFFDAQILNDELYFDYKFKEGICQNMNASFLLNKMGIV